MPYKEPKIEKLYYTIGEVAGMFQVNTSLIRFWEKEFDIIKPHKNKKGNRLFTPQDVDHFHLIYHLVKEKGMTLKGAQKKLKENKDDAVHDFEVISKLKSIRALLVDIRDNIEGEEA
jgi:DNA-binding transcriptional MerR regulator